MQVIDKSSERLADSSQSNWVPEFSSAPVFAKGLRLREFVCGLLIILALASLTYCSLAFFWQKFSRAEVFFAECAREMLVSGNFITPLYHKQPFFDKPIFVYWLIIAMFKAFGVSHFAARVPSIVASLITILSTALASSFLFGRRTGLVAAAMLASSFMYLSFSSLCMSDIFLVLFDTLSLVFIFAGIQFEKQRNTNWWLAAVSMGFAFLTKGPVGIVLPAVTALFYMAITKKLHLLRLRHFVLALASMAVIASPWFYAAYLANGQQALVHFFIQENLQRFAGNTYDVHKPFWYTIGSLFLGFAPWSILLPVTLFCFIKGIQDWANKIVCAVKVSDDLNYEIKQSAARTALQFRMLPYLSLEASAELFLWMWLFISVGFFCFSRGKCDYYTLPAYPAAAILCAHYIGQYLKKYIWLSQSLALTISVCTIIFTALVLPKVGQLVPVDKYATVIKSGPDNLRVGIDKSLSSWADEILFQSGNDPVCLADEVQANSFVQERGPFVIVMPENKYWQMEKESGQNKGKEWQVLACDRVATHSLTPGYFISRKGHIADAERLVLATNMQEHK